MCFCMGIVFGLFVFGLIIFSNLDFLFGLLGRNTSLTGRIPMWEYLFQQLVFTRPWLGFGYGAIWHFHGLRNGLALILHWGTQVMIGDNGFIDIILHLGVSGLSVLVALIVSGFYNAIKFIKQKRTLISAFPIIILVFVMVSNITLSLILESEVFVWIIAIAAIVAIRNEMQSKDTRNPTKELKLD